MKKILEFKSDPGALAAVRQDIRDFLMQAPLDEMQAELIVLALDEACTNIIRHAYDGCPDRPIRLELQASGETLTCTLRDFGKPCDPDKIKGRELEDFRPGGLGVRIMQTAFDAVDFQPFKLGTRLCLKKFLSPSHPEVERLRAH